MSGIEMHAGGIFITLSAFIALISQGIGYQVVNDSNKVNISKSPRRVTMIIGIVFTIISFLLGILFAMT